MTNHIITDPRSLVRFQLGPDAGLTLDDAATLMLEYYRRLGVGNFYSPPVQHSTSDSQHFYNGLNPNEADPRIGGTPALIRLAQQLKEAGLGFWLDIVPNHLYVWDGDTRNRNIFWDSPLRELVFDVVLGRRRRFFDVDSLVGVKQELEEVFVLTHKLVEMLVGMGLLSGLRVDHPDGLRNPTAYLRRLRQFGLPVVVEKILTGDELLPWDRSVVDGEVGYAALNGLRKLFVDPRGERTLRSCYADFTGDDKPFHVVERESKRHQVLHTMQQEVAWLREILGMPALEDAIPDALMALDGCYRTYVNPDTGEVPEASRQFILNSTMHPTIQALLLGPVAGVDEKRRREFVWRFQQWTGPTHAMGKENTAFFRQPLLISCNEVGNDPVNLFVSPAEFHRHNRLVQKYWPNNWNALDTHDSKMNFYVGARIGALSSIAGEWVRFVKRWERKLRASRPRLVGVQAKAFRRVHWQVMQVLAGTWPLVSRERVLQYMTKVMREARLREQQQTDWITPNAEWETMVLSYVNGFFDNEEFAREFGPLAEKIDKLGRFSALGQLLLMLTVPGKPVFYQGDEVWEPALLDPDNRRRQDWQRRMELLASVLAGEAPNSQTDRMHLIQRVLSVRAEFGEAFGEEGTYIPIDTDNDAVSFRRGKNVRVFVPLKPGVKKACPKGYRDILPEFEVGLFVSTRGQVV